MGFQKVTENSAAIFYIILEVNGGYNVWKLEGMKLQDQNQEKDLL